MKLIVFTKLLLTFLLIQTVCFGQYTQIPDAQFELALAPWDDFLGDGVLPTAALETIEVLHLPESQNLYDLTGIEAMVNLQTLTWGGRPSIEALVRQHAPQIRHAKNENFHLSSVEWYFDRTKLSESKIIRVPYCSITLCYLFVCHTHVNYQNGIDEIGNISSFVNDLSILTYQDEIRERGNITSLTTKEGIYTRSGYKEGAKAYVRIRSLDHLNIPVFEGAKEIQYHYFYPWNGDSGEDNAPCTPDEDADHEADWEAVGVVLDRNDNVLGYTHSVHGDEYFTFPSQVNKESQGHPILYSANESHAMYHKTGYNHPSVPFLDRCDNDGYHFNTWKNGKLEIINIDPRIYTSTIPTDPNWIYFEGRWGSYPLGPVGPGPGGFADFWDHPFESLEALARILNVEISDLFELDIFNSAQATNISTSSAQTIESNSVNYQQLLDSINRSKYRFDNTPLLEGNEMNIYHGVEYSKEQNQDPIKTSDMEKSAIKILRLDKSERFIQNGANLQNLILTAKIQNSDCKVLIEFNDESYRDQLVKWKIKQGDASYYEFEQYKKMISLDYSSEDSITLEVSAQYLQSSNVYAGIVQLIIPPCQTATSNE